MSGKATQLKEVLGSTNWHALGPLVRDYLEASQVAQEAKEEALHKISDTKDAPV